LTLVIDSSVAIAWIAADEQSVYADGALTACGSDGALVPALWRWEISNTLIVLERRGRIPDAAAIFSRMLRGLPVIVEEIAGDARGREEVALARKHQLTSYDAAYLASATSNGLLLATLDEKLAAAARTEGVFFENDRQS
jgi:predicted nucleic acid-binding protein